MKRIVVAMLSTCLLGPVLAQVSALDAKVRSALLEMANGTCSAERLAPALRVACDSQPQTANRLQGLGEIESLENYGIQQMPNGLKPTVFKVVFEHGIMTWYAEEAPDGKLALLWSDGQTAPR